MQKIVIVGGGTAGWMTAAALVSLLDKSLFSVTLVESEMIGTVGVGEATLPHIRYFNSRLGIDEGEFIAATGATYKLGIEFVNWGALGDSYIHPFGDFGINIDGLPFHHFWMKCKDYCFDSNLFDYSLPVVACRKGKFEYPSKDPKSLRSTFAYAFHIDAAKYAAYLKGIALERGLLHLVDTVDSVTLDSQAGDIDFLRLASGADVKGDFYIDCSGFQSLLLGKALGVPYVDWSHWLPCNRAIAAPQAASQVLPPFTQAVARDAGWTWKIPLQNRFGSGYVFSDHFLSYEKAEESFASFFPNGFLAKPRGLSFLAGRRQVTWSKNCVAVGLSSGFLEPLESTSIYLIQAAITEIFEALSTSPISYSEQAEFFNEKMSVEYEKIRDFIILHYKNTVREDTEFWRYCKNMDIPEGLMAKMDAFREAGHVDQKIEKGLFLSPSWVAVLIGQGLIPRAYSERVDVIPTGDLLAGLMRIKRDIRNEVNKMRDHSSSLSANMAVNEWPQSALSLYTIFS
jgi:tryptophan 7-halogenase